MKLGNDKIIQLITICVEHHLDCLNDDLSRLVIASNIKSQMQDINEIEQLLQMINNGDIEIVIKSKGSV